MSFARPAARRGTAAAPSPSGSITGRILAAALLSATLVVTALAGMFVSTSPKFVSLLVEPLSLLLTPGLICAIAISGPHDFYPRAVVFVSLIFYFAVIYLGLAVYARTSRPGTSPPESER